LGVLFGQKLFRNNLIAAALFWSFSSFGYYLVGFYTKYSPGNVFVNFGALGVADMLAGSILRLHQKLLSTRNAIRVLLAGATLFSLIFGLYTLGIKNFRDLT
jgi:hypothetical protein